MFTWINFATFTNFAWIFGRKKGFFNCFPVGMISLDFQLMSHRYVITTEREFKFYTGSNSACGVSEPCDGENV